MDERWQDKQVQHLVLCAVIVQLRLNTKAYIVGTNVSLMLTTVARSTPVAWETWQQAVDWLICRSRLCQENESLLCFDYEMSNMLEHSVLS